MSALRRTRQWLAILTRLRAFVRFLETGRLEVAQLIVVDSEGRDRVVMSADIDSCAAGLAVFDAVGRDRLHAMVNEHGPALLLIDSDGEPRGILHAAEGFEFGDLYVADEVTFSLSDADGLTRAAVVVQAHATEFHINGRRVSEFPLHGGTMPSRET